MRLLPVPERASSRQELQSHIVTYEYGGNQRGYDPNIAEINQILALYDHYDQIRGQVDPALSNTGLAAELIATIQNSYSKTYAQRGLSELRERLLDGVEACPICGIGEAEQLDHFLPKTTFGVLSIYCRNLIPICPSCNVRKRAEANPDPNRRYLHAYFEPLPQGRFLEALVQVQGDALHVEFRARQDIALPAVFSSRLDYQLERLALNQRYGREINLYVNGMTVACHELYDLGGAEAIQSWLTRQVVQEERRHHINDWRALVFGSLSQDADFCDGGFADVFRLL